MAFQAIPGGAWILHPPLERQSLINFTGELIDASTEKEALVSLIPKTGTISKVGFLTRTVTTGATVDVRLETVDLATGDPTGTLLGTNSNGSQVIADADDNTWFTPALTTGVAVTEGDLFAAAIANASTGNMQIASVNFARDQTFPYADSFIGAGPTWTKAQSGRPLCISLEYDDGSYAVMDGIYPFSTLFNTTFNNTDTPDEVALKFKVPWPARITSVWVMLDLDAAADIILYDTDGTTVLLTASPDPDVREATSQKQHFINFNGTANLTKDSFYRLAIKPTTTSDMTIRGFTADSVALMDSFDGGQNFHWSERTDAGAWTDVTTKRPFIGLKLSAFDDGAGGAAGHASLSGGMQ